MTSPDRDILISRVVDGTALDHDWAAIESLGERDPMVWRELAQSQRQHATLSSIVSEAARTADAVDLEIPEVHVIGRLSSVARWGGWAAAAAIGVAWLGGMNVPRNSPYANPLNNGARTATATLNPAEALQAYLDSGAKAGNVLYEMPTKPVLQAVPADDGRGGYMVYYVRQIVECAHVDDLYRATQDEVGATKPAPTRLRARTASGSY